VENEVKKLDPEKKNLVKYSAFKPINEKIYDFIE